MLRLHLISLLFFNVLITPKQAGNQEYFFEEEQAQDIIGSYEEPDWKIIQEEIYLSDTDEEIKTCFKQFEKVVEQRIEEIRLNIGEETRVYRARKTTPRPKRAKPKNKVQQKTKSQHKIKKQPRQNKVHSKQGKHEPNGSHKSKGPHKPSKPHKSNRANKPNGPHKPKSKSHQPNKPRKPNVPHTPNKPHKPSGPKKAQKPTKSQIPNKQQSKNKKEEGRNQRRGEGIKRREALQESGRNKELTSYSSGSSLPKDLTDAQKQKLLSRSGKNSNQPTASEYSAARKKKIAYEKEMQEMRDKLTPPPHAPIPTPPPTTKPPKTKYDAINEKAETAKKEKEEKKQKEKKRQEDIAKGDKIPGFEEHFNMAQKHIQGLPRGGESSDLPDNPKPLMHEESFADHPSKPVPPNPSEQARIKQERITKEKQKKQMEHDQRLQQMKNGHYHSGTAGGANNRDIPSVETPLVNTKKIGNNVPPPPSIRNIPSVEVPGVAIRPAFDPVVPNLPEPGDPKYCIYNNYAPECENVIGAGRGGL